VLRHSARSAPSPQLHGSWQSTCIISGKVKRSIGRGTYWISVSKRQTSADEMFMLPRRQNISSGSRAKSSALKKFSTREIRAYRPLLTQNWRQLARN
jgi:hypothetical protein